MTTPADALALLRSRSYLALLALAAIVGAPISAAAYFFLALVSKLQGWIFTDLPKGLGFHGEPLWWPIPPLVLAGILVSLTIRYLPGKGGHSPADGFKVGAGAPSPAELPRNLARGACGLEPGRGTRTRGSPDRHRRRARRLRRPPRQAGCSRENQRRSGSSRKFRCHRHPAWLAPARGIPADGSLRTGRGHAGTRAGAWPAGRRHRFAEILTENGYRTYCVGRWHLSPPEASGMPGSRRTWPLGRGFERYYGFLGGQTSPWIPTWSLTISTSTRPILLRMAIT